MLRATGNIWSTEFVRNEENYNKQEVMGMEEERINLIAKCARLEHDIEFLKRLDKV